MTEVPSIDYVAKQPPFCCTGIEEKRSVGLVPTTFKRIARIVPTSFGRNRWQCLKHLRRHRPNIIDLVMCLTIPIQNHVAVYLNNI